MNNLMKWCQRMWSGLRQDFHAKSSSLLQCGSNSSDESSSGHGFLQHELGPAIMFLPALSCFKICLTLSDDYFASLHYKKKIILHPEFLCHSLRSSTTKLRMFASWRTWEGVGVTVPVADEIAVSDRERPNVSGPIRSIKMYSYAQCTMQERLVCCGDVSGLAHMEQGSGTLHSEHLPLSLSAWGNGDSVY
jgi:hypothetical protein